MNRAPNGGYGHHDFQCDSEGPLLVKPEFTEAVWCCTFHGLLGLHTFKSHVITGSDRGVSINFPVTASAPIALGDNTYAVSVACQRQPGSWQCSVGIEPLTASRVPDAFLRVPQWVASTHVSDAEDEPLEIVPENGYLRLPAQDLQKGKVDVTLAFSARVEDRRMKPVMLNAKGVQSHRGVTLWDGPHLLLCNTEQPRPTVIALVGDDGRLRLPRNTDGTCRLISSPRPDAEEQAIAAAIAQQEPLTLAPWQALDHDAPAAFVFDLITVWEGSPLAEAEGPD